MIKILNGQTLQHKNSLKPKNKPSHRPSSLPIQTKPPNKILSQDKKTKKYHKNQSTPNQDIVNLLKQYEVQMPKKFVKGPKSIKNQDTLSQKQAKIVDEDLLCLDQDIGSLMTYNVSVKPQSAMSRYSNDLQIIQQRAVSQEDIQSIVQRQIDQTEYNSEEKPKVKQMSQVQTTAQTKSKKKSKMLYDPFVRPFIEPIKMNINVIDVLRNRRKQLQKCYASSKLNITK